MKGSGVTALVGALAALAPAVVRAQEVVPVEGIDYLSLLITWLPILFFFGIFLFLLARMRWGKTMKLQSDLLEKYPQHMQNLEDKLDRIIELLERHGKQP